MQFLQIFPTHLGIIPKVGTSKSTLEQYKNYIENIPFDYHSNYNNSTDQNILENPLFKDLKSKIINFSKNYLDKLEHIYEDLQISTSWATKTFKDQESTRHLHVNSYLSGTFYLTAGSNLIFSNPLENSWTFGLDKKDGPENSIWVKPNSDLLIIFPSFLLHKISPHIEDNTRISIAFNIVPKGKIGTPTTYLNL
jgi:uncharacterized protein (TIGR02466 family)